MRDTCDSPPRQSAWEIHLLCRRRLNWYGEQGEVEGAAPVTLNDTLKTDRGKIKAIVVTSIRCPSDGFVVVFFKSLVFVA